MLFGEDRCTLLILHKICAYCQISSKKLFEHSRLTQLWNILHPPQKTQNQELWAFMKLNSVCSDHRRILWSKYSFPEDNMFVKGVQTPKLAAGPWNIDLPGYRWVWGRMRVFSSWELHFLARDVISLNSRQLSSKTVILAQKLHEQTAQIQKQSNFCTRSKLSRWGRLCWERR